MKAKEQQRAVVLQQVEQGALTAGAAAEVLGVSLRQVRRLVAAYHQAGAAALQHGNRGRQPAHTISAEVRQRVLALVRTTYHDCNPQHLSELLAEREGLVLSRSSLRRILLAAGLYHPRQQAAEPHRQRRARYAQAGMLVQIDASPHDWLQGRGPRLTLVAAIDDATNVIPAALFRLTEDAHGYFLLLEQLVATHGRPLALYHDRHSIFQHNPQRPWSPAEQLTGRPEPTQFGRLLAELGIASIAARSPQAKGRIERLFGTLQTRLVIELRLAGPARLMRPTRSWTPSSRSTITASRCRPAWPAAPIARGTCPAARRRSSASSISASSPRTTRCASGSSGCNCCPRGSASPGRAPRSRSTNGSTGVSPSTIRAPVWRPNPRHWKPPPSGHAAGRGLPQPARP